VIGNNLMPEVHLIIQQGTVPLKMMTNKFQIYQNTPVLLFLTDD